MSDNWNRYKEPKLLSAKEVVGKLINGEIGHIAVEATLVCGAQHTWMLNRQEQTFVCILSPGHLFSGDVFHEAAPVPKLDYFGAYIGMITIGWWAYYTKETLQGKTTYYKEDGVAEKDLIWADVVEVLGKEINLANKVLSVSTPKYSSLNVYIFNITKRLKQRFQHSLEGMEKCKEFIIGIWFEDGEVYGNGFEDEADVLRFFNE